MPALVYDISPRRWTLCKIAGAMRPSVYWSRLSGLKLTHVPVPALPGPRWVRLRTRLGGICGTDLSSIMQKAHPASILQVFSSLPAVLGHENVSVIEEVGPEVDSQWRPGDRVVVESALSCSPREIDPPCRHCAEGRFTLCDHFRTGPLPIGSMIGWNSFTGGSWAPHFVAHESQLYRVPEEIEDETAVLVDPIAGALHAVLRRPPADGEQLLIQGSGLVGMGVAGAIRAMGYTNRLCALARHEQQAKMMRRYGVDEVIQVPRSASQAQRYGKVAATIGARVYPSRFGHQATVGGFDLVYDCVGSGESVTDALKYARNGGCVVEVGTTQIALADLTPLWFGEIDMIGSNGRAIETYRGRKMHTYEIVFELIRQGRLDLTGLLTHRFRIEQYREAMACLTRRSQSGAVKVAFDHRDVMD